MLILQFPFAAALLLSQGGRLSSTGTLDHRFIGKLLPGALGAATATFSGEMSAHAAVGSGSTEMVAGLFEQACPIIYHAQG